MREDQVTWQLSSPLEALLHRRPVHRGSESRLAIREQSHISLEWVAGGGVGGWSRDHLTREVEQGRGGAGLEGITVYGWVAPGGAALLYRPRRGRIRTV